MSKKISLVTALLMAANPLLASEKDHHPRGVAIEDDYLISETIYVDPFRNSERGGPASEYMDAIRVLDKVCKHPPEEMLELCNNLESAYYDGFQDNDGNSLPLCVGIIDSSKCMGENLSSFDPRVMKDQLLPNEISGALDIAWRFQNVFNKHGGFDATCPKDAQNSVCYEIPDTRSNFEPYKTLKVVIVNPA